MTINIRLLEIGYRKASSILDGKSKLPGLKMNLKDNEDGLPSPNIKTKDLSKVYKLNIGNIDELNERYQLLTNKIQEKR